MDGAFYGRLYRERGLSGGHVILLNSKDSPYYRQTKEQALSALRAFPGGLQAGGGITPENAEAFLDAGASHVIVTSYVFEQGRIRTDRLRQLSRTVGKERLVLDISCRKKKDGYYVVTDRWQKWSDVKVTEETMDMLAEYCDEFLVHGADAEGLRAGIEEELAALLGRWGKRPVTYAGGIGSFGDLEKLRELGKGRLDFTVGSALDLFGGSMDFEQVCRWQ